MAVDITKLKPLIPAMTSETAPGITISDTSHFGGSAGWKAFDGTTSYWDTQPAANAKLTARFSGSSIPTKGKYFYFQTRFVDYINIYINDTLFDSRYISGDGSSVEMLLPLNDFTNTPITKIDVNIRGVGVYQGQTYGYVQTIQLYGVNEISLFEMNKGLYTIANNAITQIRSDTDPTVSSFTNGIALSDLTKPITVEGKPSTPLQEIGKTTDKIKIYTLVPPK